MRIYRFIFLRNIILGNICLIFLRIIQRIILSVVGVVFLLGNGFCCLRGSHSVGQYHFSCFCNIIFTDSFSAVPRTKCFCRFRQYYFATIALTKGFIGSKSDKLQYFFRNGNFFQSLCRFRNTLCKQFFLRFIFAAELLGSIFILKPAADYLRACFNIIFTLHIHKQPEFIKKLGTKLPLLGIHRSYGNTSARVAV